VDRAELRRLWDRESHKYLARGHALADFPLPAEFLPRLGEQVLDAGCGAGNYLGIYRRITARVVGLDFSESMARAAAQHGPVVQGDVQQLPFRSDVFDYVASHLVISHVLDGRAALAELARVTKPGGRLVVAVTNRLSFLAPMRTFMVQLGRYTLGPCRHYTVGTLRSEGAQLGLAVRRACAICKPPTAPNLWRAVPAWLGSGLDRIVHALYPLWGGDLAALLDKQIETPRCTTSTPRDSSSEH
jgi:SAM-dependent methyltransferase